MSDLPSRSLTAAAAGDPEALGRWLRERDPARLEALWAAADALRRVWVGDAVHLRALVEISNHCVRRCAYCGLRAPNRAVARYRLDDDEVLAAARAGRALGCGTVVLQAGEDPALTAERVAGLVRRIRGETGLAVTLSLGERDEATLALWREAGAARYLLRFETSDTALLHRLQPDRRRRPVDRLGQLRVLRALGYEVGSGVMVGLPGQSWSSLVRDLRLFRDLDLDMIGLGPWVADPDTPLGKRGRAVPLDARPADPVPADALTAYKALALARLVRPDANLPATTALATVDPDGTATALLRGANVVMPDLTPERGRSLYRIYPGKTAQRAVLEVLERLGRPVGQGAGGRPGTLRQAG